MRFGETPIEEATGAILGHSWRSGGINFAKGRKLSAADVAKLKAAGVSMVSQPRPSISRLNRQFLVSGICGWITRIAP
ncbi:hypothetical protein D3C83_97530 [compost metagenome]